MKHIINTVFDLIDVACYVDQNYKNYPNIKEEKAYNYDSEYPKDCLIDVFYKKDYSPNLERPVLVNIHGGGFVAGGRRYRTSIAKYFASLGFVVFNVDYPLADKLPFHKYVHYLVKACNWIGNQKDKYNIDTNNVVITGDSSGGHCATVLATLSSNPDYRKKLNVDEFQNFNISTGLFFCGCYDIKKLLSKKQPFKSGLKIASLVTGDDTIYKKGIEQMSKYKYINELSPTNYITSDFPTSFVAQVKNDAFCYEQGDILINKLKEENIEHDDYIATRVGDIHCYHLSRYRKSSKETFDEVEKFLKKKYKI